MNRCTYCTRIIWPWQRYGWRVVASGPWIRWHARCRRQQARDGSPELAAGASVRAIVAFFVIVWLASLIGVAP